MVDYDRLKFGKDGKVTISSVKDFINWCSSDEVWDAWYELCTEYADEYLMSYKTFYRGLILAYEKSKTSVYGAKELFEEVADYWYDFALKKDKDFYDNLKTDKKGYVTLYRGCSQTEIDDDEIGTSWTTNRGIAEFFAFRYDKPDAVVLRAQVHKWDIASVITSRGEEEVIVIVIEDYEIVTREKTDYYDQYMKYKEKHP